MATETLKINESYPRLSRVLAMRRGLDEMAHCLTAYLEYEGVLKCYSKRHLVLFGTNRNNGRGAHQAELIIEAVEARGWKIIDHGTAIRKHYSGWIDNCTWCMEVELPKRVTAADIKQAEDIVYAAWEAACAPAPAIEESAPDLGHQSKGYGWD